MERRNFSRTLKGESIYSNLWIRYATSAVSGAPNIRSATTATVSDGTAVDGV